MGRRRALALGALCAVVGATVLALWLVGVGGGAGFVPPHAQQDNALLDSILRRLPTDLASIRLGRQPASYSRKAKSTWLYVTSKAGKTTAEQTQDAWYTYLILGAYDAQSRAHGADYLSGYSLEGTGGGRELGVRAGLPGSATPREVSRKIKERLAAEGITAASVSFLRPYGLAAIVEIKSSDPQATINKLRTGLVYAGLGLEGSFTRIVDSKGTTVYIEAGGNRIKNGLGWVEPDLRLTNAITGATGKAGPTGVSGPEGPTKPLP